MARHLYIAGFNPRARAGRDSRCQRGIYYFIGFNPRARAGRDHRLPSGQYLQSCFNPRARAGRDMGNEKITFKPNGFQPTRPCGARPLPFLLLLLHCLCFNPRARAGRDYFAADKLIIRVMFQPTRPCGARPAIPFCLRRLSRVSTHAPVRGATQG